MTNNNVPPGHQADSNRGLSIIGDDHTARIRPNLTVDTDQPAVIDVPDTAKIEGSESNDILLDSTPEDSATLEAQPRQSRPRRNVGPPKFFGDLRYIDVVLEGDDQTSHSLTVKGNTFNYPRATFTITSPSDLLTPLAEAPQITTLVAKPTLSWSSQKSCPLERAKYIPIQSILKNTSFGSSSSLQPTSNDTLDDVERTDNISSTFDTDLKLRLDDFDARFT